MSIAIAFIAMLAAASDAEMAQNESGVVARAAWLRELHRLEHQPSGITTAWLRRTLKARDGDVQAEAAYALAQRVGTPLSLAALGIPDALALLGPLAVDGTEIPAVLTPVVGDQGQSLSWHNISADSDGGFSPNNHWLPQQDVRAVAAVGVWSPKATRARLATGSGGGLRVHVNGAPLLSVDAERPGRPHQDLTMMSLRRGWNLVTVEVTVRSRGGRIFVRVTDANGVAIKGVRFSVDNQALSNAANAHEAAVKTSPVVAANIDDDQLQLWLHNRAFDSRPQPTVVDVELARRIATQTGTARALAALAAARELRGRDANAARELVMIASAADPAMVDAPLLLFDLALERDDVSGAREALLAATAIDPTSVLVRRARWALFADRGGLMQVMDEMKGASANPADGEARVSQARRLLAAGRPVDANLLLQPDDVPALERLRMQEDALDARLRDAESRELRAELSLVIGQQLRLQPSSHSTARRWSLLLPPEARTAFTAARISSYPQRPEPLTLQAELRLLAGDREGAQQSLAAALALAPQDQQLRLWRSSLRDQREPLLAYFDGPLPERSPSSADEGARIARHATAIRFYDNGLGRIIEETIIDVDDDRAAQALRTFRYGYQNSREEFEVLMAQRWRGNAYSRGDIRHEGNDGGGRGMYQDGQSVTVSFADVRPGDRLRIRVRRSLVGDQNWFGNFFGQIIPIADSLPTAQWLVVVEGPSHRPLHWGGLGAPPPVITQDGDITVHRFERTNVAAVPSEPGSPPQQEITPTLSVSTYDSWQEMGAWYANFIAPQLVLDDELRAVANKARSSFSAEAEVVRALYEHVITKTRYVGIELGVHGWKPYPVTAVYRRKFGDCKDKASLLVALLREAGVDANIALVRTQHQGAVEPAPASMWLFDHAIAYVPSLDLFLDGTAEFSGMNELPSMDQGATTLIVGAHGKHPASELRTIPIAAADANRNVSDYVLTLASDGSMTIRGQERFRGVAAAPERQRLLDEGNRVRQLQEQLSSTMPGIVVQQVITTGLALSDAELGYDFVAVVPQWAKRVNPQSLTMPLSLYPHSLIESYASTSARVTDLVIDHPWQTINRMRYVLPAGMRVQLPDSQEVEGGSLRFRSTITRTDDGFVVEEDTAMMNRRVVPDDYPALRRSAQRADGLMSRTIELAEVSR